MRELRDEDVIALTNKQRNPRPRLLIPATAYRIVAHRWIWQHWLARSELHLIAGAAGVGKTTLALKFAAIVSTGGTWPDGTMCQPDGVVIWTGEDQIEATMLPRLRAAGADLRRVHFIGKAVDPQTGEVRPFDPASDLPQLMRALADAESVGLVVFDPITAAISADSNKNGEVRRALVPIVNLAATYGAAVLGVSHFAKASENRNAADRVLGSVAFVAGPRLVMCAIRPDDEAKPRRLVRIKSNLGPDGGGFAYSLTLCLLPDEHGGESMPAQFVDFGEALDGTARKLMAVEQPERREPVRDAAREFLLRLLAGGARPVDEIKAEIKAAGVCSWRTLETVKAELHIVSSKEAGTFDGRWTWSLPASRGEDR